MSCLSRPEPLQPSAVSASGWPDPDRRIQFHPVGAGICLARLALTVLDSTDESAIGTVTSSQHLANGRYTDAGEGGEGGH